MHSRRSKYGPYADSIASSAMARGDPRPYATVSREPHDVFQYTTPRTMAVTKSDQQQTQSQATRMRLSQRISRGIAKLERKVWNNRYKLLGYLIKCIIAIASVGYAMYQAATLILVYCERPVEINLKIVNPKTATIPAVSICFEYKLDADKLKDTIETRKRVTASKYSDPTVEVVINTTPGIEDLVESCQILNHQNEPVPCGDLSTVRQAITRKLKCFTWFSHGSWKNPENETRITYSIRAIKNQEWVLIKLKNLTMIQSDIIGIGIHQNHVPVEPDLANPQFTEVRRTWYKDALLSRVTLTWELSKMERLPPPYASNCIDYKKSQETVEQILLKSNNGDISVLNYFDRSGPAVSTWLSTVYASRNELIDSCIGYLYATRHGDHWPSNLLAYETKQKNFYVDYISDGNNSEVSEHRVKNRIIQAANDLRLCKRLFPSPECIEDSHTIILRTSHYDNAPDNMEIALFVPTDTQTHMTQMPKYESREIIAIISGIFSFWVGISVMEVALPLIPYLCAIFDRSSRATEDARRHPMAKVHSNQLQQRLPFYVTWSHGNLAAPHFNNSSLLLNKKRGKMVPRVTTPMSKKYNVNW